MPLDQVANFVRGETDAAVDATQTTISVVDASIFPDPTNGEYNLVLWYAVDHPRPDQDPDTEIVRVTGRDTGTNDLTVTRAQEGTTGASHPSGSALQLSPTAALFGDVAATDAFVEDFTTEGGSGTVPTSQGDGSLAMEAKGEPNVPGWQLDQDISVSGSTSYTFTLNSTYDLTLFVISGNQSDSGLETMTWNGLTSGYSYRDQSGATTTSASEVSLGTLTQYSEFLFGIDQFDEVGFESTTPIFDDGLVKVASNSGTSGPVNQITIDSNVSLVLEAKIYGLNI